MITLKASHMFSTSVGKAVSSQSSTVACGVTEVEQNSISLATMFSRSKGIAEAVKNSVREALTAQRLDVVPPKSVVIMQPCAPEP